MRTTRMLPLLLVVVACASESAELSRASVRDSAGIAIVENTAADQVDGTVWTLGDEPTLRLGLVDGAMEEQFSRVMNAIRLADGRIVVGDDDRRAPRVAVFSANGEFTANIGQVGEGPGDFRNIGRIFGTAGNETTVWDYRLRRLTSFDAEGQPGASQRVDRPPCAGRFCATFVPLGQFGDGRILGTVGKPRINPPDGMSVDSTWLHVADLDASLTEIDSIYIGTSWSKDLPGGTTVFGDEQFGAVGKVAVASNGYIYSAGSTYEFRRYSPDGDLTQIVRLLKEVPAMTPELKRWLWDVETSDEAPTHRDQFIELFTWLVWPETVPAYDDLKFDDSGNIWARVFPDSSAVATWHLFDEAGELTGSALVPSHLEVQQIGSDYLLALDKGEFDESVVSLYSLAH